jgi:hypothetical protein
MKFRVWCIIVMNGNLKYTGWFTINGNNLNIQRVKGGTSS